MKSALQIEAKTAMLIRRSAAEVYGAFVDPSITTQFWFTKSSGRLTPGAKVRWDWEMYGISVNVNVKELEPSRRILLEWGSPGEPPTDVEFLFEPRADNSTFVTIRTFGFQGDGHAVAELAADSASGFSFVLAGLKALLEHDVRLNLIQDRHPTD